jgi:transposase
MDTVRRWVNAFRAGRVEQLMRSETGKTPDKRNQFSAKAAEELKQGLATRRWCTGLQVRQWLSEEHHIQIAGGWWIVIWEC